MKIKQRKESVTVKMSKKEFKNLVDLVGFGTGFVVNKPFAGRKEMAKACKMSNTLECALEAYEGRKEVKE